MTQQSRQQSVDDRPGRAARQPTALRGLHAQTVETLGSRIVLGHYAPGFTLSTDDLEDEFGIS